MRPKREKRIVLLLVITLCFVIGLILTAISGNKNENQIVNVEAKLETIESLSALESMSDIIVKGVKINRINQVEAVDPEYNQVIDQYTLSNIKITELYKDSGNKLAIGDYINVRENAWVNNGTVFQVSGYQLMENHEEYLLFLGQDEKNNYYYPRGVLFGKVALDEKVLRNVENGSFDQIVNAIHQEALEKYIMN